jgi:maltose O-acetyltransferase
MSATETMAMGVDPVLAPSAGGRWGGALAELGDDARHAARWCRRGRLATSPLVPQALRRWLLARGGVRLHRGVSGLERCWFQSGAVTLGAETYVNAGCWFEGEGRIDVGAHCLIGPEVLLLTSTHRRGESGRIARESSHDDVVIGDRCWIGARAMVLAGVTIGDDVVIAAGAVVTSDCESGHLYGGVPARRLR